jgi:shikimate kinase
LSLISLVGLPGSGKSTIARRLANGLSWRFLDADLEVEREAGCNISALFERFGEQRFRDIEQDVISRLTREPEGVIATGGGVVLRQSNRLVLHERSTVVYLRFAPEALVHRLKDDGRRPLFRDYDVPAKLRQLFEERDPLYEQVSHLVVDMAQLSVGAATKAIRTRLELS